MRYLLKIENLGGQFRVEYPELGLVATVTPQEGTTEEQIASGVFIGACNELRKNKKPIPLPDNDNKESIYINLVLQLKIRLWNYMLENRYRQADIAKMLGVSSARAGQYVNFDEATVSVEKIEELMLKIGIEPTVSI